MSAQGRPNPVVRLLASVWFGISMLVLVLIYSSVLSAVPSVRAALEVSEMRAFQHWLFVGLIGLFALSLSVATWTRIRWNVVNAGVLMVHAGLLLLTLGSVAYFGKKIEGDVVLVTPRVELLTTQGDLIPGGEIRLAADETWERNMPAFGGNVRVRVLEVISEEDNPAKGVRLAVDIGNEPTRLVDLDADKQPYRQVPNMIVRLVTPPAQDRFFVSEDPVLYYSNGETGRVNYSLLRGLPIHRERYDDAARTLVDRDRTEIPSKRRKPTITVAGAEIPTGWFENWDLPIKPKTPGLPFDVEVTGYVPYIAGMATQLREGGTESRPALELSLLLADQKATRWLVPNDPEASMLQTAVPFEIHWITDESQVEAILADVAGPHELTVEVLDPPVKRTYSVEAGQKIEVEGTRYSLEIERFMPNWPMMSPGFEGAVSPMASVNVDSGKKKYNRTVIQRFPQLSQDIDEQGVRHTEGPYDSNIKLHYRMSAMGWVHILAGPDRPLEAVVRDPDGSLTRAALTVGSETELEIRGVPLRVLPERMVQNVVETLEPVLEPAATRRPSIALRSMSAIELTLKGRGNHAGWEEKRWVRFSSYPLLDAFPIEVRLPGEDETWQLTYSRRPEALEAELIPHQLVVTYFPGRNSVESWHSDFIVREDDEVRAAEVYTNQTTAVGKWTLFQSGADPENWRYTVIGVGSRDGIWPMSLGCILITVGCLYAFYVKPVLKRKKRAKLLEASRAAAEANLDSETETTARALSEVSS